jgi:hypothetical protein
MKNARNDVREDFYGGVRAGSNRIHHPSCPA